MVSHDLHLAPAFLLSSLTENVDNGSLPTLGTDTLPVPLIDQLWLHLKNTETGFDRTGITTDLFFAMDPREDRR